MKEFYVNLKRFDIPKKYGGICPLTDPVQWIRDVVARTMEIGLGHREDVKLTYLLGESLLIPALETLALFSDEKKKSFSIGCQSVYREDVAVDGNFGAYTSKRPAAAMASIGVECTMIGHSEERKDKLSLLAAYDPKISMNENAGQRAAETVNKLLNQQICCGMNRGMKVLFCIGETAEEKGSEDPVIYEPRVRAVLKKQILEGLAGVGEHMDVQKLTIGYEPIWAIGPGKTPPSGAYVAFVSEYIKEVCLQNYGKIFPVVYGGGLKEENAAEMAAVKALDGGLVALTKFTQPIAFDVESLKKIIEAYQEKLR